MTERQILPRDTPLVERSLTPHSFQGMKELFDEIRITDQDAYIEAHMPDDGWPI